MTTTASIDELVDAFQATLPWPLDDFQVEALRKLETHSGVLVSAPTSSGKTVVAEYAIWRCLQAPPHLRRPHTEPHNVVYTTPLKALSNQKYHDLCDRYGAHNVGLVTGEHTVNDGAPVLVMTTEILRNVLYDEPERLDVVGDVVLDEVHYIDDYPRGTVWEEIIIEAPQHIRFIGLSATISNVEEVAAWMTSLRGSMATVVRTERPVSLELWLSLDNDFYPLFDEKGNVHRRTMEMAQNDMLHERRMRYVRSAPDNDLLHVVDRLRERDMLPAIYFIFSRRGCREALARCAVHNLDLTTAEEKARIDREYEHRLELVADDDERRVYREALGLDLLRRGLAMHHAGMLPYAKETVERLFLQGLIKVVFATETLSLGLNMPARACVLSSFTKFDGTGFHALTAGELTQLMGRAGRRGIDVVGHGIILKEQDVDVRDIYDAAIGGEMEVESKFSPTYTMTLNLLRTRSVAQAEMLMERSFGQYQNAGRYAHWEHKERNLQERLADLKATVYRHPTVPCTERTLTQYLSAAEEVTNLQARIRRSRREHWRDSRRGRFGGRAADPGQRLELMRRQLKQQQTKLNQSPCRNCPYLAEHRAHRLAIHQAEETLRGGEAELRAARDRYREEFRAYRGVLTAAGFLAEDRPTELGALAASLYGESALLVAEALEQGWFEGLEPAELAAALVMVVNEDRGRDRPTRVRFPSDAVEQCFRSLRGALYQLATLEREHGLETLRPLSFDYVAAAYFWTMGVPLANIEPPPGADLGDVVKAIKNLYSMLRQIEQAVRDRPLHALVVATRERVERDLIRRV
ncbi:MAG TPA: DEAD/DEAH box helicase [Candidatus Dormibacteraeota bacterium]|nr:DEAD/DEAH box helicase [Candidatus Dormibacteraeota bacterium]